MNLELRTRKWDRDTMMFRHPPDELGQAITVDLEASIVEMGRLKNLHRDALTEIERLETAVSHYETVGIVGAFLLEQRHQRLLKLVQPLVMVLPEPDSDRPWRTGDLEWAQLTVKFGDVRRLAEFVKEEVMAASEKSIREEVLDWLLYHRNLGYGSVIDIRHPNPKTPGREGGVSRTPGAADIVVLALKQRESIFGWAEEPPSLIGRAIAAIAVELKTEDGKQSEDQERWQKEWEGQGGIYLLVRNSTELRQEFERLGIPTAEVSDGN